MQPTERYLVMITEQNNNKFYHMKPNGSSLVVEYGRIGGTSSIKNYRIEDFNHKYNEKIRKGYSDKTELFLTTKSSKSMKLIDDIDIRNFIDKLMKFSNDSVSDNYTVNAKNVTPSQIEEAQNIINKLSKEAEHRPIQVNKINEILIELYHVLPRKMSQVKNHLIDRDSIEDIRSMIMREQDLLDSLQSSMTVTNAQDDNINENDTILDILGLEVNHCTDEQVKQIKNHMGSISDVFVRAFHVKNKKQHDIFEEVSNMKKELLWHGSRNENIISILQKSLMIRPSGVVITGAMFGNGIYFANKAIKAMGYSSVKGSYWARGSSSVGYLFVFEVAVGNQKHIYNHNSSCYNLNESVIKKEGCDSVYAHGGADLKNDEFIIYNSRQCRVKYIIEIKQG